MAKAEFEEKVFEGPLNNQLLADSRDLYTPGQVLESALGFDAAMLTCNVDFWNLWQRNAPMGLIPRPSWWASSRPLPNLPDFSLNLFLQHKRPAALRQKNAKEWSHWAKPYFRYPIIRHQQEALEACAASLGKNGLVLYSAPAFVTLHELFQHTRAATLVAATNFVEVAKLHSHAHYTYVDAGTSGRAFSEPVEVQPFSMTEELAARVTTATENRDRGNILAVANDSVSAALRSSWRAVNIQAFETVIKDIVQHTDYRPWRSRDRDGSKWHAYVRVAVFCQVVGWCWLVAAAPTAAGARQATA